MVAVDGRQMRGVQGGRVAHLAVSAAGGGSAHSSGSRGSSGLLPPIAGGNRPHAAHSANGRLSGGIRGGLTRLGTGGGGLRHITLGRESRAKPRGGGGGGGRGGRGLAVGGGGGGGVGGPAAPLAMGELPLELDAVMVELASGAGEHELGLGAAALALHDHDEARARTRGALTSGASGQWAEQISTGAASR